MFGLAKHSIIERMAHPPALGAGCGKNMADWIVPDWKARIVTCYRGNGDLVVSWLTGGLQLLTRAPGISSLNPNGNYVASRVGLPPFPGFSRLTSSTLLLRSR